MTTTTHGIRHSASAAAPVTTRAGTGEKDVVASTAGRRLLAVLRLATGFIFLWAFLDKTFGLGYSTQSASAWIHGGKPSQGFLTAGTTGPLKEFFASIASPATDVLFMIAMLALGVAVMLGIGLRISAVVGSFVLALMWLAEWPLGINAASSNPIVDYHVIYALSLIVVAVLSAGETWGLGAWWKRTVLVRKNRWLI